MPLQGHRQSPSSATEFVPRNPTNINFKGRVSQKLSRRYSFKRGIVSSNYCNHHHQNLSYVGRQQKEDELHNVCINRPSLFNGIDDGAEVVVCQDHISCVLGNAGPSQAHSHPDVGLLQGRCIVDAIAGHGAYMALALERAHNSDFVARLGTSIHLTGAKFDQIDEEKREGKNQNLLL